MYQYWLISCNKRSTLIQVLMIGEAGGQEREEERRLYIWELSEFSTQFVHVSKTGLKNDHKDWGLKPSTPHSSWTRGTELHLSLYIKMTWCYASVFISMTIFPEVSCPSKWLNCSLQDFPKIHQLFNEKITAICTLRFFECFTSKSWPCCLLWTVILWSLPSPNQVPTLKELPKSNF